MNGHAGQSGLTLLEMLTTITLLFVLASLAAPGLRTFIQNNRAATQANELVMSLNLARNEAATRGNRVSVCASTDGVTCSARTDWTGGWLLFDDRTPPSGTLNAQPGDDEILRAFPALQGGGTATGSQAAVTFLPNGFLDEAAPVDFALRVPDCSGNQGRDLRINLQGRTAVTRVPC
jgi:type IV fimbrial biogenesis protein FimT